MNDIAPLKDDIKAYCWVVFSYLDGLVPLRSFVEKGGGNSKPPRNIWIEVDDDMSANAFNFAMTANRMQSAFYAIPGVVEKSGEAGSNHITQMQVLLIDLDDGDIEAKLKLLESALGKATLIVESGGITAEGQAKLHIYWQLTKGVRGDALQKLLQLRYQIALSVGGDLHFKSAHQPIRVAGSVYHKNGTPKLVKIRSYSRMEYELEELIENAKKLLSIKENCKLGNNSLVPSSNFLDFNSTVLPLETILISKVYEGGSGEQTRFNHLNKIIGYWLRRLHDGLITEDEAIEEIHSYNLANVIPSWPKERLQQEVKALWKLHLKKYGAPKKLLKEKPAIEENKLIPIDLLSWQGSPPAREWIIEGWLPRGYVTAIYGDGGVGKSLLAQQLMTCVATGNSFLELDIKIGKVYALMCEDDANELWRRQVGINSYYGLEMVDFTSNIRLVSRVGENNLLMLFNNSDVGQLTEFFHQLRQDILEYKPDLIILDTAADLFGGNENNRPQVRQFIQTACASLARDTGGAVLLCAHPSESGIQKGTGSGGSTAWNNTVRTRWYLKRAEGNQFNKNHRVLTRVKSNYATIGQEEYLEWNNGAFTYLNPLGFSARKTGQTQGEKNDAERDRKTQQIIYLIETEAIAGRFYTVRQFAESFEGTYELGSKRSIQERISIATTQGYIKFFTDPKKYGLDIKQSSYGYLCTDKTIVTNKITENKEQQINKIVPTHFKSRLNGELMPLENINYEQ